MTDPVETLVRETLRQRQEGLREPVGDLLAGARQIRRRRRATATVVAAVAAVLAVALSVPLALAPGGGRNTPVAHPTGAPRGHAPDQTLDPLGLIGLWRLELPGASGSPVVRLDAGGQITLWRSCGALYGGWTADRAGLFAAELEGGAQRCFLGPARLPQVDPLRAAWPETADHFESVGGHCRLLDGHGRVVAVLVPDRGAAPGPPSIPVVPQERVAFRRHLVATPSVPAGVRPAPRGVLMGRWVVAGSAAPHEPFLSLSADGTWRSSDGCNQDSGPWSAGAGGSFVALGGPIAGVGCADLVPVEAWVGQASRIGLQSGQLVLVDDTGHVLGRLSRS